VGDIRRVDFREHARRRGGQACLWHRYDDARSGQVEPGRYMDLRFLRAVRQAEREGALSPPALALARSFADYLREDRDGKFFAYPNQKTILQNSSVRDMKTFKKHWPAVMKRFGIRVVRKRGRRGNVYVWEPEEYVPGARASARQPDPGRDHHAQSDVDAAAIAGALWRVPEARQVLARMDIHAQNDLELQLVTWLSATPARVARDWPWVYVAHLEAKAAGPGNPFERTSMALMHRSRETMPDPQRVRELEAAFRAVCGEQEDVG